jgi:TatD DNase family protein
VTPAGGAARAAGGPREWPPTPEPLPVPVPDSHCHLDLVEAEGLGVPDALAAAAAVGVPRIVQVGCDRPGARWAVDLAERYDDVVAAVAVHPNEAPRLDARGELTDALDEIDRLAASPRVRAVGETGLDFYRTGVDGRGAQEASFRAHVELARRRGKTLVVHDRDAHADVLRVLAEERVAQAGPPVVFHCFSGDAAMARHCTERGWYLSFAGTVTFKNASGLRAALAAAPLDRVLVETDAPYLTPMPWRGRPNASYLIPHTVRAVAAVREMAEAELCRALSSNTAAAFGGPWGASTSG